MGDSYNYCRTQWNYIHQYNSIGVGSVTIATVGPMAVRGGGRDEGEYAEIPKMSASTCLNVAVACCNDDDAVP